MITAISRHCVRNAILPWIKNNIEGMQRLNAAKEDMTKKEDDPWGAYDDDSRYDYFTRT